MHNIWSCNTGINKQKTRCNRIMWHATADTGHIPHDICDDLYMTGLGSGTVRRCGLVGVGVALLKEVCLCEGRQWDPPPNHEGASLFLAAFRWRCRTLSSSCTMPAWKLPCSHLDDNGLNLWTYKPAPIKCCPYNSCLGHGVCSQQ